MGRNVGNNEDFLGTSENGGRCRCRCTCTNPINRECERALAFVEAVKDLVAEYDKAEKCDWCRKNCRNNCC